MSNVYLYIQFKIKNMGAFKQYGAQVPDTVALYGGKTIAVNKAPIPLHGNMDVDVCVVQQWPSLEAAQAWLDSPEYAPLKKLRDERAMTELTIVPVPAVG
ncbi:DUF1330 domain-containing protein [Photobacterium rosenbergii]|uniref:DUF1330 domain-containing protein n=1 Tax=Photobacterium rosenbergii TaxID=294936 RepID=A0A2T3N839_9GAMM|nr:DUF1330 domain-containing protein [Photobacterium rosenbergii]PSW09368.1 DUF1330 domain-containing protein [Photobacterium rosenbergii]